MPILLGRDWWLLAIRGVLAVLLGSVALIWSGLTLGALVLLFGVYVLADGMLALAALFGPAIDRAGRWPLVLEGLTGIAAGVVTFLWPGFIALELVYLIAAWAFVTGVAEIATAIRLREQLADEWLMGLSGVVSVILGVVLVVFPGPGALAAAAE